MSRSITRSSVVWLALCTALPGSTLAAQTPRDATSADARLRALYTAADGGNNPVGK